MENMMKSQYTFSVDAEGSEIIKITDGGDFPYKIKNNAGEFILSKAFSPRAYIKPTFKKIKSFSSRDEALAAIIKRHNKSCEHMADWTPIV